MKDGTLLVTGGAGFIGSNFIHLVLKEYKNCKVINYDLLTYAGNLANLKDLDSNENYTFIKGDICNREQVEEIFRSYKIDTVVNFAAQTHVDRSVTEGELFYRTNTLGTHVLLECARKAWSLSPEDKYCKDYKEGVRFHQVSTDEVYGALGSEGKFTEETPLSPNSPYSASKAGGDFAVRAYHNTFALPVTISRCSNNYGPYQFPEKLIPLMINNCLNDRNLPIYGDGGQIRDWLHVEDHCRAIIEILDKGQVGEVYNIGGNAEKTNMEIVHRILKYLNKPESLIVHVKDRPGHDRRYAIDCTKITSCLGWRPDHSFEEGLNETIEWYVNNNEWMAETLSGDYMEYYNKMYK